MRAARLLVDDGLDWSVVYETWDAVETENAIEGIPSLPASDAAPLYGRQDETEDRKAFRLTLSRR